MRGGQGWVGKVEEARVGVSTDAWEIAEDLGRILVV